MPRSSIDHLAITAPSLDAGVAYVEKTLGVSLQTGGEHVRMGTHNCLLKLGEKLYLEGFHPQAEKIIDMLEAIGFEGDFRVFELPPEQRPYLVAHIQTPSGLQQLSIPD